MNEQDILAQNTYPQTPEQKPQESEREQNLRYLRERADQERKAREDDRLKYEARMKEMEDFYKAQLASSQKQKIEVVDDSNDFNIDNDSYVEGRHLSKTTAALRKEIEENKRALDNYRKEADRALAEQRVKLEHPDFYEVVNEQSLAELQKQDAIAFESLMHIPDTYKRLKMSRTLIERYGLVNKTADIDERIERNLAKPRSAAGTPAQSSDTPLSSVAEYERRRMTPDRKKQVLSLLEDAKRRY